MPVRKSATKSTTLSFLSGATTKGPRLQPYQSQKPHTTGKINLSTTIYSDDYNNTNYLTGNGNGDTLLSTTIRRSCDIYPLILPLAMKLVINPSTSFNSCSRPCSSSVK